jgi:hypothetical protein
LAFASEKASMVEGLGCGLGDTDCFARILLTHMLKFEELTEDNLETDLPTLDLSASMGMFVGPDDEINAMLLAAGEDISTPELKAEAMTRLAERPEGKAYTQKKIAELVTLERTKQDEFQRKIFLSRQEIEGVKK